MMYVRHDGGQFVQERVISVYLHGRNIESARPSLGIDYSANLLQKLHVLPAHSGLGEFGQPVGGGWVVQHDLENLTAEKVGESIEATVAKGLLFGT